jgi:tripartite-type tricarboxylate transporter receptor subunit TctC
MLISTSAWSADKDLYKVLIGFGPGGTDSFIRSVTSDVEKQTDLIFLPINRPGANGIIALREYFDKKDNKTLLGVAAGQILVDPIFNTQNYYLDRLKMIGPVFSSPMVLAVAPNYKGKVKTLDDLFDKSIPPQKINIAVTGQIFTLAVNEIARHSHHDIQPIIFKGGGDALPALLGGHVDMQIDSLGWFKPKLPSIIFIANTSSKTIDSVPSFQKYITGFSMYAFYGIGVAKDIDTTQLEKEINKGFIKSNNANFYTQEGYLIDMNTNSDFISREVIPKYNSLLKQYGTVNK